MIGAKYSSVSVPARARGCAACAVSRRVRGVVRRTERGRDCMLRCELGFGGLRLKPQNAAKLADGAAEAPG